MSLEELKLKPIDQEKDLGVSLLRDGVTVHLCPSGQDGDILQCCGKSLADLSWGDLLSMSNGVVTCEGNAK